MNEELLRQIIILVNINKQFDELGLQLHRVKLLQGWRLHKAKWNMQQTIAKTLSSPVNEQVLIEFEVKYNNKYLNYSEDAKLQRANEEKKCQRKKIVETYKYINEKLQEQGYLTYGSGFLINVAESTISRSPIFTPFKLTNWVGKKMPLQIMTYFILAIGSGASIALSPDFWLSGVAIAATVDIFHMLLELTRFNATLENNVISLNYTPISKLLPVLSIQLMLLINSLNNSFSFQTVSNFFTPIFFSLLTYMTASSIVVIFKKFVDFSRVDSDFLVIALTSLLSLVCYMAEKEFTYADKILELFFPLGIDNDNFTFAALPEKSYIRTLKDGKTHFTLTKTAPDGTLESVSCTLTLSRGLEGNINKDGSYLTSAFNYAWSILASVKKSVFGSWFDGGEITCNTPYTQSTQQIGYNPGLFQKCHRYQDSTACYASGYNP